MWLLLGCGDPVLRAIDAVELPAVPGGPATDAPVVALTADGLLFDPGPWRELGGRPAKVVDAVAAVEPLARAAADAQQSALVALAVDAGVPYGEVVPVIVALAAARADDLELRVQGGALPYAFPRFCAGDDLLARRSEPCVFTVVSEHADGLAVESLEVTTTCTAAIQHLDGPGSCRGLRGDGPATLRELLSTVDGPPCDEALVVPLATSSWGEVVALLAAARERHPDASLGAAGREPRCVPAWIR